MKIFITPTNDYYQCFSKFSLSNISFGRVKETSQGDVSFTHRKHMLS